MDMLDKLCKGISKVIYMVCCVFLAMQVLIVSGIAFSRYVFRYTPPWGESVALICMVWFCLLSAALAISDDLHLKVTLLDNFISERTVIKLDLFNLVLIVLFGVVMVAGSFGLLQLTSRNTMTGLGVPSVVLYAVIPVTGLAFIVAAVERGRKLLCHLKQ